MSRKGYLTGSPFQIESIRRMYAVEHDEYYYADRKPIHNQMQNDNTKTSLKTQKKKESLTAKCLLENSEMLCSLKNSGFFKSKCNKAQCLYYKTYYMKPHKSKCNRKYRTCEYYQFGDCKNGKSLVSLCSEQLTLYCCYYVKRKQQDTKKQNEKATSKHINNTAQAVRQPKLK